MMKTYLSKLFSLPMLGAMVLLFVIVILIASMAQDDKPAGVQDPSRESSTKAVLREANQLLTAGKENTALGVLSRHLQAWPDDIAVRMARAELMLKVGKIVEGEREIDAVLQLRPNLPAALWDKGLLMQNRGEPGEPLMKRAADHPNASPSLVGQFGMLLFETDRVADAAPYLERAAKQKVRQGNVYTALGKIAFDANEYPKAERLLTKGIALSAPSDIVPYVLLADVYKHDDKADKAVIALSHALRRAKDFEKPIVLIHLGRLYSAQSQWTQAADAYAKASLYPEARTIASYHAANCYYLDGKYARAMTYIDQAAELRSGDPEVRALKSAIEKARFRKDDDTPDSSPAPSLLPTITPASPTPTSTGKFKIPTLE
jgi:tetratricopeptide (TPR) repeat protein